MLECSEHACMGKFDMRAYSSSSLLLFFSLGFPPSSGVGGMDWISCFHLVLSSTSSSFTRYFPYLFYTSLSTWFSVFLSVSFDMSAFRSNSRPSKLMWRRYPARQMSRRYIQPKFNKCRHRPSYTASTSSTITLVFRNYWVVQTFYHYNHCSLTMHTSLIKRHHLIGHCRVPCRTPSSSCMVACVHVHACIEKAYYVENIFIGSSSQLDSHYRAYIQSVKILHNCMRYNGA